MSSAFQSFVGVDLHKCSVTLTAVDAAGEIKRLKISTKSTGKIEAWLRALPGPVWMAVEACPFVEWFIDRFRDCVQRIDIADATELASRRGKRRKTDWNDSLDIAARLARGECPLGFIADEELMQLQECPTCGLRLQIRVVYLGKRVACHDCGAQFTACDPQSPEYPPCDSSLALLARVDLLLEASASRSTPASSGV